MTVTEAKEQLDELYTHRTMVEMEKDKLDWVKDTAEVNKIDMETAKLDESILEVLSHVDDDRALDLALWLI